MTNLEAVSEVNRLCSNMVDDSDKYRWLDRLDGLVQREILGNTDAITETEKVEDVVQERDLLVPEPYCDVYRSYLEMMIHSVTGEITKYNNALQRFQSAYRSYGDYVRRTTPSGKHYWRLY